MYQYPELTPPMTSVAILLTRKQHLISRLEEDAFAGPCGSVGATGENKGSNCSAGMAF
ncbi:hypothetical protein [Bradyrhizobium monzae]|uniref:hypothetical protein n=1 Tax=Bradyrhizobium sp. Oc8 TaxID=2876780 RepID=UPI001F33C28E|nr:hypothetical protein [Bradyrhizobium sp. Oc8]